jgi:M6 family metalloprotease-like protein
MYLNQRPRRKPLQRRLTILFGLVIALAALAFSITLVSAAPAAPVEIPLTQPDGSTFTARLWGDEWSNGYETNEGYTIIKEERSGYWVYAAPAADGKLAAALDERGKPMIAGRDLPQGLDKRIRPPYNSPLTPQQGPDGAPLLMDESIQFAGHSGNHPTLVLLVQFKNQASTYPAADFQQRMFGSSDSVRAFYKQASFNQLDLTPAAESYGTANDGVIGWLTLNMDHPNDTYGAREAVKAALVAADPYINYAAYDTKAPFGEITVSELHVVVVTAGYEQSYCGYSCPGNAMWGHRWDLAGIGMHILDGVQLVMPTFGNEHGGYMMFGEIHGIGDANNRPATIGIMAHEMGHDLGWPDLYDISLASEGVGRWSIMGSGSWNGILFAGDSPALPDAWLKWHQGWITPMTAASGTTKSLRSAAQYPDALLVGSNPNGVDWQFYGKSGTGEFWLVENRYKAGFDMGLPAGGILIWHIDEGVSCYNDANADRDRPLMELEQADGLRNLYHKHNRGDAGDPYPGASIKYYFDTSTNPNSRYYDGTDSKHQIQVLTQSDSATMQVKYTNNDQLPVPYKLYLPVTLNTTNTEYTGLVHSNGLAMQGITVKLAYTVDNWSNSDIVATTTTDKDGRYKFTNMPVVGGSKQYLAYFYNPSDDRYLYFFECIPVVNNNSSFCEMNIKDVVMTNPLPHAENITLPYYFSWQKRNTSSDSYYWTLYDYYGFVGYAGPLGYVGGATIWSLNNVSSNYIYFWSMDVETPYGFGSGYYMRQIVFSGVGSPGLSQPRGQILQGNPVFHLPQVKDRNIKQYMMPLPNE